MFGFVYLHYFQGGDTWSYHNASLHLAYLLSSDPVSFFEVLAGGDIPSDIAQKVGFSDQPRALLMVKITSILSWLTGGNYWLSSLYFSLFSFFGLWTLSVRIISTYPDASAAALVAFIFYPSVLFWGGGISKEPIFLGGFGYLVAWFWPSLRSRQSNRFHVVLAIPLVLVLFKLKYYYVAIFIPVMLSTLILYKWNKVSNGNNLNLLIRWILVFIMLLFMASWLHPNLRFDYLATILKSNAQEILSKTEGGASVSYLQYSNPIVWVVMNFPLATLTGLLRPYLGDWGSHFQQLAILENVVISCMMVGSLLSLVRRKIESIEWFPMMVYVMLLAGLIALATPNFGTLVRYKVAYMPVFVFLVLYQNPWWERLVQFVSSRLHLWKFGG